MRDEVRPRLAVVHLTYVDPGYLATGGRRHDAWTTGDVHDIAYSPRTVLVVENRDSRLWFPPLEDALVVEGGGRAAAALLVGIPWIRRAENIVYWGDIDSDGLSADESAAYHAVATAGPAPFRRIEQERIPGEDARAAMLDLLRA